ncbi:MAG: glutamine--tRNA ligase/YqeY domain fusion protein [Gammaproteobacteria bacterium]|nr:glutamine--tRNA ligase/YqeY domain fusion protein [Gammaproteobacteria bacterium]
MAADDFIRRIVADDLASGKHPGVVTRFPPEPNGFLHIGHAKSICLNFGVAAENGGSCYLRYDDTNPVAEEQTFVDAIREDVNWLGFDTPLVTHASDYFPRLYEIAEHMIGTGHAFVDSSSADKISADRGTLTSPGRPSPYRERSAKENLDLFRRMRAGDFGDGEQVLRARIDMASPNINLRDPVLYRVRHVAHARTGRDWCIYPMYDLAHTLSDALEGITHSLCTLEFEDHRPLYEWLLDRSGLELKTRPRQYEFGRLNLGHAVTSKRRVASLIRTQAVEGWDDPRLVTLSALRRRGYPPEVLREFCARVGVSRSEQMIGADQLETVVRDELNRDAPRAMAVARPLKVVLTNLPENHFEELPAGNHPQRPEMGSRNVPFSRVIYIERTDFMEDPPRRFFRLRPGGEVRLRNAYIIRCDEVVHGADGEPAELHCSVDPDSRSGGEGARRKVKGTVHWVSAAHSVPAELRLYRPLFNVERPDLASGTPPLSEQVNSRSLEVAAGARLEPSLANAGPDEAWQFERLGYYTPDSRDSSSSALIFNRIAPLRSSYAS